MSRLGKLLDRERVKASLQFGGSGYTGPPLWSTAADGLWTPYVSSGKEPIGSSFVDYVRDAYKANGPVFACILARAMPFSEVRFQFQRLERGRPTDLFGSPALGAKNTSPNAERAVEAESTVSVSVPDVVTGEPVKAKPVVPPEAATLVTVPLPPPAPSATFAPLMRAVSSLAVLSYHRSPLLGVEGSPATLPTFRPAAAAPGAKVWRVFEGQVIAPEMVGVVIVGEVANTAAPVPVSSVRAPRKFALLGVPHQVAMPLPKLVIPVPPFATASVPPRVMVPLVVMGLPVNDNPVVPPESATLVTVPLPPPPPPKPVTVLPTAALIVPPEAMVSVRPEPMTRSSLMRFVVTPLVTFFV